MSRAFSRVPALTQSARTFLISNMSTQATRIAKTIKTRILIISDTHNAKPADSSVTTQAFRDPLPEADVLLHCGDLTYAGRLREYESQIEYLKNVHAELKLVIGGNHDRSLDKVYWDRKLKESGLQGEKYVQASGVADEALALWKRPDVREAGIIYLEEGLYSFTLRSGAVLKIYASPYQPEFCDWAFPYKRDEDKWNPENYVQEGYTPIATNPIPNFPDVDVVMTHGPPVHVLDQNFNLTTCGCIPLLRAIHRARPQLHCFGHIHEGNGAVRVKWSDDTTNDIESVFAGYERIKFDRGQAIENRCVELDCTSNGDAPITHGESTLFVNAAIRTALSGQKPIQPPWLVNLMLPQADTGGGYSEKPNKI